MVLVTRRIEMQFVPHSEHDDVSQNRIHDLGLNRNAAITLEFRWSRATVHGQSLELDHYWSVRQYGSGNFKHRLPVHKYCRHVGFQAVAAFRFSFSCL